MHMTPTSLGTTLTVTWPTMLTTTQQASLQGTVSAAVADGTVTYVWHANAIDSSRMLPTADTPTSTDEQLTCPVCQAEFKLGSTPL